MTPPAPSQPRPMALAALALALAASALTGCSSDLSAHETQWQQKAVTDYSYNFRWSCFCSTEYVANVHITVAGKAIASVQDLDAGKALTADRFKDFRTIDGLFTYLHDAEARHADSMTVTYDPLWSYPTSATIDYVKNAADDEMAFTASAFQKAVQ